MSTAISQSDIDRFREDGYLVLEDVFDENEVAEMQSEADRVLEWMVNSSLANDRQSGRLAIAEGDGDNQTVKKIQPVADLSLVFSQVLEDERLVDPMREVMGDEPKLMEEKLNYKQPLTEPVEDIETTRPTEAWPVHSDWAYYQQQDYPKGTISSAIALDDLTEENGTMRFWPGSEFIEHRSTDNGLEVPPEHVDEDEAVPIEAPAGSAILFNSEIWHDSSPNDTDGPRRLMIFSHYPETPGNERGIIEDERNGPARLRESPWESEYQRKKNNDEFEDPFEAPIS